MQHLTRKILGCWILVTEFGVPVSDIDFYKAALLFTSGHQKVCLSAYSSYQLKPAALCFIPMTKRSSQVHHQSQGMIAVCGLKYRRKK